MQTPLCATGLLSLGAISGGFGGKVRYLIRDGWLKAANLYLVVAMDPGERKSAVFKAVFGPVYAAEKAAAEAAQPKIAEARAELVMKEARLKHLNGQAAKAEDAQQRADLEKQAKELAVEIAEFKIPVEPVYVVDDETLESLGKTLIEQGGC
jgi:replicative DNA helicase